MKLLKKSEVFILPSPLAEPQITWHSDEYAIERLTKEDGTVIWFGYSTNWVRDIHGSWSKLGDENNEGTDFHPCDIPLIRTNVS
jgi:hypothetical protein